MPHCPFCNHEHPRESRQCASCGAALAGASEPPPGDVSALDLQIRALLRDSRKIEAIRIYREATGVGLAEAKSFVEALERGTPQTAASESEFESELLRLLARGEKIQAVKLYRERNGSGLKEAKDAVEALAARHGIVPSRGAGCAGLLAALALLIWSGWVWGGDGDPPLAPAARIAAAKPDGAGFLVHTVASEYQAGETQVRVLIPERLEPGRRYPVVYVLPVEAANGRQYGDGLLEVQRHDLHNKFGLICVQPTFSDLPWYADHPTDRAIRQESYLLQAVVPFVEKTYPVQAVADGRWLLGFSKSGWGAFSLALRHPDRFGRAAAWDAPLSMTRPDRYGMGPIFGTQENFERYQISTLLKARAAMPEKLPRLILLGYDAFREQQAAIHVLMLELKIPHQYQDGPAQKHTWHSGWVEPAVRLLADEEIAAE